MGRREVEEDDEDGEQGADAGESRQGRFAGGDGAGVSKAGGLADSGSETRDLAVRLQE